MLKDLLGVTTPGALTLKLYMNDVTPGDTDTAVTYTEMSGQGYASKALAAGSWVVAQNAGVAEATYAKQTWTFTGGAAVPVYGYYVVDAGGVLRWSERFVATYSAEFANDAVSVTPKFTFSSAN